MDVALWVLRFCVVTCGTVLSKRWKSNAVVYSRCISPEGWVCAGRECVERDSSGGWLESVVKEGGQGDS
jgi:hypothetical protein